MAQTKEQKAYQEFLELCDYIATNSAPNKNESEFEKRQRIEDLLKPKNFVDFCEYYFDHYIQSKFGWFHLEAAEEYTSKDNSFTINEWAREHAKSVFINVFCQLWLYLNGKLTGFILASETEDKAKVLIGDIEAELRSNQKIIADFGDQNVMGTHRNALFSAGKGINFWAFGIGQNPAGVRKAAKRPNSGVVDDADSKKKYEKNEQRLQEDLDWILGEFMGCLAIKGKHFSFNNNRVCDNGLTAHMVGDVKEGDPKREGAKHIKVYATEDPVTHEMLLIENGGVPAWSYHTIENLKARFDEVGYRNTMRQYYHKHIREGKRFKNENLPWVNPLPWNAYDALVGYLDPAYGDSGKGCYRALVLLGKIGLYYDVLWAWLRTTGNMVDAQYRLNKMVLERLKESILTKHTTNARFTISNFQMWTEAGTLQKARLDDIYKLEDLVRGTAWKPRYDMESKGDKKGRIESLEPLSEHKYLRFSSEFRKTEDMQTLRNQFIDFPNGFIDGPDAVVGAKEKADKLTRRSATGSRTGSFAKNSDRSLL